MEELVKITLDQKDARIVLAALDAYGIHLGELVAFGNAAALDLEGDVLVIDPRLQELTAKMAEELQVVRERVLQAIQGEEDDYWGQAAPAIRCWCGLTAISRRDEESGEATEDEDGIPLCASHDEEFMAEVRARRAGIDTDPPTTAGERTETWEG